MNQIVIPIFLLSLPRSGSTLLQRLLASHPKIKTTAEPWFLLHYIYSLKKIGIRTEYHHSVLVDGIKGFYKEFPKGIRDYIKEMRNFAMNLYSLASNKNIHYFLDKTPRYYYIVSELFTIFPNAKFIFLWRNPLSIAASIIETWGKGYWNLHGHEHSNDLKLGLLKLIKAHKKNISGVFSVNYEEILLEPNKIMKEIFTFLDLNYYQDCLVKFNEVNFKGTLGDKTGRTNYKTISKEPMHKWKSVLNTPIRKRWSKNYLRWIGKDNLSYIGYDYSKLVEELSSLQTNMSKFKSDLLKFPVNKFLSHIKVDR